MSMALPVIGRRWPESAADRGQRITDSDAAILAAILQQFERRALGALR
jgi:hypothetical protein